MNEYLINDKTHPHYGDFGTISEDNKISKTGQYIMRLTTCMHGVDRCAVYWEEIVATGKIIVDL